MAHEAEVANETLVELGIASVETKGAGGPVPEGTGLMFHGISDD